MGDRKHPPAPADLDATDVRGRPGAAPSRPRWPDREIGDIATRQQGLITRVQLIALGVDRHTIDHALKRGRLRLIHRGAYALGHTALTPVARDLAAVLAVGEGALLSHRSALALWGLVPRPTSDVDVTVVARDAGRRRPGIRVHCVKQLDRREATRRQGIPVTTAARALLDVARDLTPRELERAFDDGLKRRLYTRNDVATTAARGRGRPGAERLQTLAAAERRLSTVTESEKEEQFLALVRRARLPEPEVNVRLGPYTVDFLWRPQRLVVEIDGYEFHSTRKSFEGDRLRDLNLDAADFKVVRFSAQEVEEQSEFVLAQLTRNLTERRVQSERGSLSVS